MDKVKEFIINFFIAESDLYTSSVIPDLELFNNKWDKLHTYVVDSLRGNMGLLRRKKLKTPDFYEYYKDEPPTNPRHLFKISHYESSTYGDVWVCYCSGTNPDIDFPILTHAFFMIREEKEFKVARKYILSDQGGMSTEYGWEEGPGLQDLTFESLGELQGVERYLEPKDRRGALKLYHQDA